MEGVIGNRSEIVAIVFGRKLLKKKKSGPKKGGDEGNRLKKITGKRT